MVRETVLAERGDRRRSVRQGTKGSPFFGYPGSHSWDAGRRCCGLSHQWSAIIGIRLCRAEERYGYMCCLGVCRLMEEIRLTDCPGTLESQADVMP